MATKRGQKTLRTKTGRFNGSTKATVDAAPSNPLLRFLHAVASFQARAEHGSDARVDKAWQALPAKPKKRTAPKRPAPVRASVPSVVVLPVTVTAPAAPSAAVVKRSAPRKPRPAPPRRRAARPKPEPTPPPVFTVKEPGEGGDRFDRIAPARSKADAVAWANRWAANQGGADAFGRRWVGHINEVKRTKIGDSWAWRVNVTLDPHPSQGAAGHRRLVEDHERARYGKTWAEMTDFERRWITIRETS